MQTNQTNGSISNGTSSNGSLGNGAEIGARSGSIAPVQEARPAGTPADGSPVPAPHDLLTRLRDKWGNRLGWSSVFSIPTVEDVPLEETALAPGLRVIEAQIPVRAATLHHFYDMKLRPALRRFWQVLAEEGTRLEERNRFAAGRNGQITAEQTALEGQRDAATAEDRRALKALEDGDLLAAHAEAAQNVAKAGGWYDPNSPSEGCVLRHARTALEVIAARLGLPGPHGDAHAHLPGWLGWALTGIVGALVGLSLGIVTHVLEADTLGRHLGLAAGFVGLGFGLATVAKWAVRGAWYRMGQDYYLGCPRSKWGVLLAGAFLRSVFVLVVDVVMERQGLLALMQLQSDTQALTGHAVGPSLLDALVSWTVPLVVTLAYLYCAGDAGYLEGRREEVKNRLHARQEEEWAATDATRRSDPAVQAALHALSVVREMLRRRDALSARVAALATPFEAKIAALEGQRLPEREELDTAARHRVQDALDNFQGAQYTFDVMWEEAVGDCEGVGGGWMRRLLRAFGGYRPPRRKRGEKGDRGER